MKKPIGRPKNYSTKSVLVTVSVPEHLLAAVDAYLVGEKKRSQAFTVLLAQALNVELTAAPNV